jgi:hypothetical protein
MWILLIVENFKHIALFTMHYDIQKLGFVNYDFFFFVIL